MKQKILIVEDDPAILTGLVDLLASEGYLVSSTRYGSQALQLYEQEKPDLILLDIMLPEKSGYEVCREIRKKDTSTPIAMLTAKAEEVDKVVGLEIGADDYIVKPFSTKELLARVRAMLRRSNAKVICRDDTPIQFGDVRIDPKSFAATKASKSFPITAREIQLLQFFIKHDNRVLERSVILDELWGIRYQGTTRTLDQHIAVLRRKIEDNPAQPRHILTVHGTGYRFISNPGKKSSNG